LYERGFTIYETTYSDIRWSVGDYKASSYFTSVTPLLWLTDLTNLVLPIRMVKNYFWVVGKAPTYRGYCHQSIYILSEISQISRSPCRQNHFSLAASVETQGSHEPPRRRLGSVSRQILETFKNSVSCYVELGFVSQSRLLKLYDLKKRQTQRQLTKYHCLVLSSICLVLSQISDLWQTVYCRSTSSSDSWLSSVACRIDL